MHVHLCITATLSQVQQRPSRPLQLRPGSEFLNSVPSKVLKANREIYKPGTARMVSGFLCKGCYVTIGCPCHRQLPTMVHSMHSRSIVLQRMELEQQDPPFGIIVHMGVMDGDIHQYRAVVSQSSELVHSGDYVKLHPSFCQVKLCLVLLIMFIYWLLQFTYGQLVATIKPPSEHTLCLVQGFETFKLSNGQQCLNNVEHCSL